MKLEDCEGIEPDNLKPWAVIIDELDRPAELHEVISDLDIDSLEYIELIRRLEQIFSIRIEEEDLQAIVTLGDLCRVVDRKRAETR
jgi:acyl carrier protein